ncbi:MAG: thermonuclease family protein [Sphingomonadaceae bacterium]|nr:thermonuclease family protein [Sphingomonadaceae bacterium]
MVPLLAALIASGAPLQTVAAGSLVVHDGDTVRLGAERMRLDGIDAPELRGSPACRPGAPRHHDCTHPREGERSRDALAALLASSPVTIRRVGDGGYGRTAVRLTVGGGDVSCTLWRGGWAAPPHDHRRYGWPCQPSR